MRACNHRVDRVTYNFLVRAFRLVGLRGCVRAGVALFAVLAADHAPRSHRRYVSWLPDSIGMDSVSKGCKF